MPNFGGKAISLAYARQLAKNYEDNKLGKPLLANDTQGVWFSKECILEALGLDPKTETPGITGLRMYFGAYEKSSTTGCPANSADDNKLTLVMVETGTNYIEVMRGTETEIEYTDIITEPMSTKPAYPDPLNPEPAGKYFNEGQSFPPPTKGQGLGLLDF